MPRAVSASAASLQKGHPDNSKKTTSADLIRSSTFGATVSASASASTAVTATLASRPGL